MLRFILVLLVPLTLGWKLALVERDEPYPAKDLVIQFLSRHGFGVDGEGRTAGGLRLIHASAGACRMDIAEASPDGWNRDIIRDLAKTNQPFFVFRGEVYTEQPTWLTVTHSLFSKHLHTLGIAGQQTPVLAVAATPACSADQLPWAELRG